MMKTDLVEIFQTIRASLQPYTANGFAARTNSEVLYDIWTEKKFNADGEKIDTVFFASVQIESGHVNFCLTSPELSSELHSLMHPDLLKKFADHACLFINELDDVFMAQINEALIAAFTLYKQKGWV